MFQHVKYLIRNNQSLYQAIRNFRSTYYRIKYRLRNVPATVYISKPRRIESDLIAGPYCHIGPGAWFCRNVKLGKYVMFAPDVAILGGDHEFRISGKPIIFSGRSSCPETRICDDVWVGYRAIVLAGVIVERGAIVAAGSVVVHSVGPYEIVGGAPAKRIGFRFNDADSIAAHDRMLLEPAVLGVYAMDGNV